MVRPSCKPQTDHGVRGRKQRRSGEAFSTDRVFFQQQQADHHDVDVCPDGAVLEKAGNLQEEKATQAATQTETRYFIWP